MTKSLILIHTAEQHRATFDALRDRIAPDATLKHLVRPDWLTRARAGEDLSDELQMALPKGGRVLCTCSTLGPLMTALGVLRIDQPMMAKAAQLGGPIVMAYCLDSTYAPSLSLLEAELEAANTRALVHPLPMPALWPLFDAGMPEAFAIAIAGEIRQAVAQLGAVGSVVLAQASMAGAAALLGDLDVPVLSSPELALRAALR